MDISYHKAYSGHLGRDMEYKRYGRSGRPVVVFPTSQGRFYQFEDSGGIGALTPFIDDGRLQIFTVDGIDSESFFNKGTDHQGRIGRHEQYFDYVRNEALPEFEQIAGDANGGCHLRPIFTGCSMGGFHSSNFVFRFPELAAGLIALSGVYSANDFFGKDRAGPIYFNSPLDYMANLRDNAILDRIRAVRMAFCCGQGAWEERMLAETHRLEHVFRAKHIPAWFDYWGEDVAHDWPWWHKQLPYFFGAWLEEDASQPKD